MRLKLVREFPGEINFKPTGGCTIYVLGDDGEQIASFYFKYDQRDWLRKELQNLLVDLDGPYF